MDSFELGRATKKCQAISLWPLQARSWQTGSKPGVQHLKQTRLAFTHAPAPPKRDIVSTSSLTSALGRLIRLVSKKRDRYEERRKERKEERTKERKKERKNERQKGMNKQRKPERKKER